MRRLKRPPKPNIWYFDEIVRAKRSGLPRILRSLRPHVVSRYRDYVDAGEMLETVARSELTAPSAEALEHCYSSSTSALEELKADIVASQDLVWRSLCPYCGIDTPSTLDHYLCKTRFPEYAVLSDNLVPACSICNTIKGDRELEGGERRFVHFYVDNIPDAQWLYCQVDVSDGDPEARFRVAFPSTVPGRARNILEEHYKRLDLLERFAQKAVPIFVETRLAANGDTRAGYAHSFAHFADGLGQRYGQNFWRRRLYDAMAQSNEFLDWLVIEPQHALEAAGSSEPSQG